jgi:hypothetical protein
MDTIILANAVFTMKIRRDSIHGNKGQTVCYIKYVRLENISRRAAIPKIAALFDHKEYADIKFKFWVDTYCSSGGQPEIIV